jgi:flagellar basal-body rod protein FlgC
MQAQTLRVSTAANNIANAQTPGYSRLSTQLSSGPNGQVSASVTQGTASSSDGDVDLTGEMTDLIGASISFKANAAVFETGADMWAMLASIKRD